MVITNSIQLVKGIKTESDLNLFIRMYIQLMVGNALSTEFNIHLSHDKNTTKSEVPDIVNRFIMVTIERYLTVVNYLADGRLFIQGLRISHSNIKVIREFI